jgi:hypothetical protein
MVAGIAGIGAVARTLSGGSEGPSLRGASVRETRS